MQVATPKKGYKLVKTSFGKYEEIPEEWELKKLGDICNEKPKYGANSSAIEHNTSLPRYVRITDISQDGLLRKDKIASIQEDEAKKYLLKEGDIVFARSGSIGLTYLYKKDDGRCAFAGYLIRFVPNQTKVNIKFLSHYTHSHMYWKWISSTKTAATISNVNAEQYSTMPILLPPLSEQQQIASILSNVDDTIQKTDQIIEQTQRLKKGMMQKLLTRGIGHTKFKKIKWLFGKYEEIPEEWEYTNLESLSRKITDGEHLSPIYTTQGIPFITAKNVQDDGVVFEGSDFISKEDAEISLKRCNPEIDDVLLVSRGATVGRLCVINTHKQFCLLGSVILIKLNKKITSNFLLNYLRSFNAQKYFKIFDSTAQNALYIRDIKKTMIPLPPFPEQKQITSILSNIDTQIQKEKLHKSNLERLKKGLMQKLLTGQIRVK